MAEDNQEQGQVNLEVPSGLDDMGEMLLELMSEVARQQYFRIKVSQGERGRWRWMIYDEEGEYRGGGPPDGFATPADAERDASNVVGNLCRFGSSGEIRQ